MQADTASDDEPSGLAPEVMNATTGKPGIRMTQPGSPSEGSSPAAHPPTPDLTTKKGVERSAPGKGSKSHGKQRAWAQELERRAVQRLQAGQDRLGSGNSGSQPGSADAGPQQLPFDQIAAEVQVSSETADCCVLAGLLWTSQAASDQQEGDRPNELACSCIQPELHASRQRGTIGQHVQFAASAACRVFCDLLNCGNALAGCSAAEGGGCRQAGQGSHCQE